MPYTKALIPLGLFLAGVLLGWSWTGARWDADVAETQLELAEHRMNAMLNNHTIERLQVVADNALTEAAAAASDKHERRVQYVTKEVIKYVESSDAGKCSATDAWVRAYNAGWNGGVPGASDAPRVVDGAAAGVRVDAGTSNGRGAAAVRDAEQPKPQKDARDAAKPAAVGAGGSR